MTMISGRCRGLLRLQLIHWINSSGCRRTAFEASISPQALGRFLAFRLNDPCPAMDALAEACVRDFDPFRAPLSEADIARRRKAGLSPAQDARMLEWGYPYIFEDFRFHMTLTSGIADDAVRARVLETLSQLFAYVTGPHRFDSIAIYRQADREAPFEVMSRFTFTA